MWIQSYDPLGSLWLSIAGHARWRGGRLLRGEIPAAEEPPARKEKE
jgi:hypothetical protein